MDAKSIIATLDLKPHPEGGYFKETFRDPAGGDRGHSTAIYYLLEAGDLSHWHRVLDAVEVWHWYAGAPLELAISEDAKSVNTLRLGPDLAAGVDPVARRSRRGSLSPGPGTHRRPAPAGDCARRPLANR